MTKTPAPMSFFFALRIIVPFALGYFLSYWYRVVNAVIAPDLIRDLSLDAGALGLLTAAYFLIFAAFQVPLGILLDRYGARRVNAVLLVFAALGALDFAYAENLSGLTFARALIGFGVSAGLMASFKAYVVWFSKDKLPLVNGFHLAAGGLGALAAAGPVEWALSFTDWRGVFIALSAMTAFVAALVFFASPEKPGEHHGETSLKQAAKGVATVFKSRVFWRVSPFCVTSQATFLAVQGLWAGPWLKDVAEFDRGQIAQELTWIAGAMVLGFAFWGVAAERLSRHYHVKTLSVALGGMVAFMAVQLVLAIGAKDLAWALWPLYGLFGTSGVLVYAALSQAFPENLAGRVNTALNLLVFISAFALQWAIGLVLEAMPHAGLGRYSEEAYMMAFSALLALQLLTLAWALFAPRANRA